MGTSVEIKLSKPMRRYLVNGVVIYVFELAVIVVAQQLGANAVVATGLSFWLGLIVSFVVQKFVTFQDKRVHRKLLTSQLAAFSLLVLLNFGFTVLMAQLLKNILPAILIRTLALAITTIWNFYLYKTRIFKMPAEPVIY